MSLSGEPLLARQLLVGWRWFDDRLRAGLAEAGFGSITSAQSMVFPYLDADGTRQTELAERLGISKQAVHQLVAALVRQGLLELRDDPRSARARLVVLTDRGHESVVAAGAAFRAAEQALEDELGAYHVAQLRRFLIGAWPPPTP